MAVAKRQSNSEYHADRTAISRSQIADFIADPPAYRDLYVLGNGQSESSDVLDFGNLFHATLLSPDELLTDFVEVPAWALNGSGKKKGRAFGSFARQHPGKTFVTGQEIVLARSMADSARQFGREHLAHTGYSELSIYWECPHTGLKKKTKPDWFYSSDADGLVVIDYKSTESHDRFPSHFRRFRYWLQHPHYCEGIQALTGIWPARFIYAAVDKSEKPRYQEHELWPASQEKARDAYIRACERLAESLKTDVWEQPEAKVQMLTLRDSDL